MVTSRLAVLLALGALLGCPSTRGGGGGDDDDSGGGGNSSFIAPYSACSGASVDELWQSVFGGRLGLLAPVESAILSCISSADDCEAILACTGLDPTASCDPDTFDGACEGGSVGVTCDSLPNGMALERRYDCRDEPNGNSECVVDGGYPMCSSGTCDGQDAYACDGDVVVMCMNDFEVRADCSEGDRTCIATEGDATCGVPGDSCVEDGCDGDIHVQCESYAEVVFARLPCGDMIDGATCVEDADGPRCGLPSAEEECEDGATRCEGSVARSCLGGKWFDVDCSTFQDGDCATGDEGVHCVISDWP
jgi:hypothetical protein